jgi:hypothetical protein
MTRFLVTGSLFFLTSAGAFAQAPGTPASPAGATTTIDQEKRGAATPTPVTERPASSRPGNTPLPMNIRIQGEGIKMPACTAESREGEACKK